jgi:hypothetical protein
MNVSAKALALACIALICAAVATTQQAPVTPPQILTLTEEFPKPGKGGATHEKTEGLYLQAFDRANSKVHYLGMEELSGKPRALFFAGYESMAAWQQAEQSVEKDSDLSAAIARADLADGELLESTERSVWIYDAENSYPGPVDMAQVRYFEIERFQVRPGQDEWIELAKLVKAAYAKAMPHRYWALYENVYGAPESSFLVITPMKSASEIDDMFAASAKFMAAAGGEEGMKHMYDLESKAVASSETNLFVVNPRMSRPPESWIKSDPDFWTPNAQKRTP